MKIYCYILFQQKSIEQSLHYPKFIKKTIKNTAASYLTEVEDKLKEKAQSNGELFLNNIIFNWLNSNLMERKPETSPRIWNRSSTI
ncbi:MAG: hypothetical protein IPP53_14065 [Bacteroidetes bacterium]|nr:hypothetical protein [Bacteroidota bacterium]